MKRKLKIGLDFDGVIADSAPLKPLTAKRMFGIDIPSESFNRKYLVEAGYITTGQYDELQMAVFHDWDVGQHMEPVAGAIEYIQLLLREEYLVQVISNRSGKSVLVAKRWMAKHGIDLEIVGVGYGVSKSPAACNLGLDVFIDDDFEKLRLLQGIVPNLFLLHWERSREVVLNQVASRVFSWTEFYLMIQELAVE